ncbi:hypothetical protein AMS68_000319 [Peltaster fructicola]|uniref:FAD dependent oxidoreductase domain-containing protein n=1 Tax=Peltaster fructicola TaxID=286661 RepID=A0A6H0XJA9_9PEZI|nr:hypothetical protein AMS68_000319 [Peltaster fructicola]
MAVPSSILIIGSGVFGLSTAHALAQRPEYNHTKITMIDRVAFPAPDAGSVDSSRLIRADYTDYAYGALAAEALKQWRGEFGDEGRYTESGFAVLVDKNGDATGQEAADDMLDNMRKLGATVGRREDGADIVLLKDQDDIKAALPGFTGTAADSGYVNYTSGWAHAENGLRHMRRKVEALNRVIFKVAEVKRLIFEQHGDVQRVAGAEIVSGEKLIADQTILAAGAWSGKYVDLRGIATASGQPLAYMSISDEEQERLLQNPALINPSNFMYIIQPRDNVLKVARHSFGWSNPQQIEHPERPGETISVSLPRTKHDDPDLNIPSEGEAACRSYLAQCMPEFKDRPWLHTRICWYSDTPSGDWVVDHHPRYEGLLVATGDSGHAYKFLPVLGERVVDVLEKHTRDDLGRQLMEKWQWPSKPAPLDYRWTDEWRGGPKGMVLDEELAKK